MAVSLTRLVDAPTGIELAWPLDVLISTMPGRWGTNWRSAGDRLNVDPLNFGSDRHLAEVHASLNKSRGRRLTRDVLDRRQFVLERTDDGSSFCVTAVQNNGAVRGLSIVYANRASEPLVKAIAASFSRFPGATAAPARPPADPGGDALGACTPHTTARPFPPADGQPRTRPGKGAQCPPVRAKRSLLHHG